VIRISHISAAVISAAFLAGCSAASSPKGPDLGSVLDRTVMALEFAEAEFEKPEAPTEAAMMVDEFSGLMRQAMNLDPQFYENKRRHTMNADNPTADFQEETDDFSGISDHGRAILLGSILVVALCGIVYELIIGAVSSYLLGNSIYQFSITIGFFMFAMGIGSYLSQFIRTNLIEKFVIIEIILAIVGGICSISLFLTFPFSPYMCASDDIIFAPILEIPEDYAGHRFGYRS